ncbi:hypothetical protein D9756_003746 [Leucocoprinus leucothites]|uniref:GST N-terminal domain-containing protein n=1 Tax=Leucocoprinus leucothites TaxID=201217 RepID=A0A8H5DB54_9AGAR|nr:hypothetical protein D9756_003746 [Leucoagaricus leucothites]
MSSEESHIPKAILYYNPRSVWSAVALLGLYEKGYGTDEVELQIVDLATVPTLVVPLQKTLSEDVESRYKAITESKVGAERDDMSDTVLRQGQAIAEFLDKSRSARSRTNTTSDAPAPMLTPATIAFLEKSNDIIDILHSEAADPSNLWYFNARDIETLRKHSVDVLPVLKGRATALTQLLDEAASEKIHASEKTKQFWTGKKAGVDALLDVFLLANKANDELSESEATKRAAYFTAATNNWTEIKKVLQKLDKAVVGPYALGDQISIADLHLSAWLARIASLVDGSAGDDGKTIVKKLGNAIGEETVEERRTKIGTFWDEVRERESWKKVYGTGVF